MNFTLTSVWFFAAFVLSLFVYYLVPGRIRWVALLVFSVGFFLASSTAWTGLYLLASIVSAWLCLRSIAKHKAEQPKKAKTALTLGIVFNVGILAVLKYSNFALATVNALTGLSLAPVHFPAPLGISFYTLQLVGLLLDAYWGVAEPTGNVFQTALFIGYGPQLTSGPIARWGETGTQLFAEHRFEWKNVVFGMERMLWGVFKKLVISARLAVLVDTIYADPATYNGLYVWFAAIFFMFQLYTDFSGCMDIIIGASECYGVRLPENFRTPFFSRSVQEFWQRWHISLGAWVRDYILYPVLRTNAWRKLTKWIKTHWGKKAAKQLPAWLGMLVVWFVIGLWHGGDWKFVLGSGIWYWFWIVLGQWAAPVSKRVNAALHIDAESFGWKTFQRLRTFAVIVIGNMFFRLDSLRDVFSTMREGLSTFNPWIFFDGSMYALGLDGKDFCVAMLGLLLLLTVSILQEKQSIRERLARQNGVFQFIVMLALFTLVLLFGQYGPGYNAASFIYANF